MRRLLLGVLAILSLLLGVVVATAQPATAVNNASISGTVTSSGVAASGVFVKVLNTSNFAITTTTTAANGTYTMGSLAAGTYHVEFTKTGLVSECWDNITVYGPGFGCTPVVVIAGQAVVGINAALAATPVVVPGSISGTVTDQATGQPIQGITVGVARTGGGGVTFVPGGTKADGTYTATGLVPGEYSVGFSDSMSTYDNECYDSQPSPALCTKFDLASGQAKVAIGATMLREGPADATIAGTVTDQADVPLAGVNVSIKSTAWGVIAGSGGAVTGADGTYKVRVHPASYNVSFALPSLYPAVQCYDGIAGLLTANPICASATPVVAAGSTTGIDAMLTLPVDTAPAAPTAVVATPGQGQASIQWAPPADDGGSPIIKYMVSAAPGGAMCMTATTSCVVTGLTNGATYTFTVTAENAVDIGPASIPSAAVVPTGCGGVGAGPFSDVPSSHAFCGDIEWLVGRGVTAGYIDGTFRPTGLVSRQAMASFLYKYEEQPSVSLVQPFFADVPATHPFYAAIQWMADSGLSTGSANPVGGKPLFKPTDSVSRQAMAAFLWRNADEPPVSLTSPFFADVTGGNLFTPVQWMAETQLSTGTPNLPGKPLYKPANPVSRQAVAAFLNRYDGLA